MTEPTRVETEVPAAWDTFARSTTGAAPPCCPHLDPQQMNWVLGHDLIMCDDCRDFALTWPACQLCGASQGIVAVSLDMTERVKVWALACRACHPPVGPALDADAEQ